MTWLGSWLCLVCIGRDLDDTPEVHGRLSQARGHERCLGEMAAASRRLREPL